MFSFFSSGTQEPTKEEEKEQEEEEIQEPKEVLFDEEEVSTSDEPLPWSAPDLNPEDVTCLINMISGCARRGVFKINEYEVILPVFRKLCLVARKHPTRFNIVQKPIEVRPPFGKLLEEQQQEAPKEVEQENIISSPVPRRKKKGKRRRR